MSLRSRKSRRKTILKPISTFVFLGTHYRKKDLNIFGFKKLFYCNSQGLRLVSLNSKSSRSFLSLVTGSELSSFPGNQESIRTRKGERPRGDVPTNVSSRLLHLGTSSDGSSYDPDFFSLPQRYHWSSRTPQFRYDAILSFGVRRID